MTCENSPEIEFHFVTDDGTSYLEIRPRSMRFDRSRGEFDYCKAEFSQSVADHIRPHLEDEDSILRHPLAVYLLIRGEIIYRLLYTSDGVRFGENGVHIEFQDPQKYLTRGVVDWRQRTVELEEAYRYVFSQRDTNGPTIFDGITFTVPDESYTRLVNQIGQSGRTSEEVRRLNREHSPTGGSAVTSVEIAALEERNVENIIKSKYSIDFDKISPWECITKLNQKFGVTSWAHPDGNLYIGAHSPTGVDHVAAQDDGRVWKISDYQINAPRDPVTRSVVRGGWISDPNDSVVDEIGEILNTNRSADDFRVEGVAEVESTTHRGQEITETLPDAKRDSLEGIAKRKMINKQRDQQSGVLEILPELSGNSWTDVRHVSIGDYIRTIPPDGSETQTGVCESNVEDEWFDVVGVHQELLGDGSWNLRLDVVKQLDGYLNSDNISTRLRYYNPASKEYIEGDAYSARVDDDEFFPRGWGSL